MAKASKPFLKRLQAAFRKVIGPSFKELLRTGKIAQTLWDASQMQRQSRDYYRKLGELAIAKLKEGSLQDIHMERLMAKIEYNERILKRQDRLLRSYQQRTDISRFLDPENETNNDRLDPV